MLLGKVWQHCLTDFLVYPLVVVSVWGLIYSVFGKTEACPGGSLFSLFALINMSLVLSNDNECFGVKGDQLVVAKILTVSR